MSFLARIAPWLFEEVTPVSPPSSDESDALNAARTLLEQKIPPLDKVVALAQDPNVDVRKLLSSRIRHLVEQKSLFDHPDNARLLLESLHYLTEDPLTDVRVALASALKDVAQTPPKIARKLAQDAERAVAEPIIRYSLSLSDEDLLELIAAHPQGWQTVTIAGRQRVSPELSHAVIGTGNVDAGTALITNDGAIISPDSQKILESNPFYEDALRKRQSLHRRIRRDWAMLTDRSLYVFLRNQAKLDKQTTRDVIETVHQRISNQNIIQETPPGELTEEQLKDTLLMGESKIVLTALAARANTDEEHIKRMIISAEAAKPVVALCAFLQFSPQFSVLIQQRITRLAPDKILYPKDGTDWPLTAEDIRWQLEFFGII